MCAITKTTNQNWIIKMGNLRPLLKNLEIFFENYLNRTVVDLEASYNLLEEVAKTSCTEGIISILELFMIAIVKYEQDDVADKVKACDKSSQQVWMQLAQRGFKRTTEIKPPQSQKESDLPRLDTSIMSPISTYKNVPPILPPVSPGCFSDHNEDIDRSSVYMERYGASHSFDGISMDMDAIIQERDDLRKELEKMKKDNMILQSNLDSVYSKADKDGKQFRSLLNDHEKQISMKDEELQSTSRELSRTRSELDKAHALIEDYEQKHVDIMDQLDLAKATSLQLQKAEMSIKRYKEKIEKAGDLSQSITELEDQTEAYMLKNIELENSCREVPKLKETVKDLKNKLALSENRNNEQDYLYHEISNENELFRSKLRSAEKTISLYKQEAMELREQQRFGTEIDNDINTVSDITLTSVASNTLSKEKMLRLEVENSNLKDQLAQYSANNSYTQDENDDFSTVEAKYKNLVQINRKLKRDKDKLEFDTKEQLNKFQQKYLSALQECKSKLNEKTDHIKKQDQRIHDERDAHKREEKLLSYAVYEIGSAVIQMQVNGNCK